MIKKGQLQLGNAPMVVLMVGLTFLVMATVALIGQKYGAAIPSTVPNTTVNETFTTVTEAGEYVSTRYSCNFESPSISICINSTDGFKIDSTNYTISSTGLIAFTSGARFNNTDWKCTYSYYHGGVACTVNKELETNISDNTSIAGIILTISLVGIVLAILVGVFLNMRRPRI